MPVLPAPLSPTHEIPHGRFTSLATPSRGSRETSVWRVELAPGTLPTEHVLTREEIFVVLAGSARVHLDGTIADAGPGDAIVVPAGVVFGLENPGSSPLSAVCCMPVGGAAQIGADVFVPPWAR